MYMPVLLHVAARLKRWHTGQSDPAVPDMRDGVLVCQWRILRRVCDRGGSRGHPHLAVRRTGIPIFTGRLNSL